MFPLDIFVFTWLWFKDEVNKIQEQIQDANHLVVKFWK